MIRFLLDRLRTWRERRDPAQLVARLYRDGIIDDEMLLAARGQHPSQPLARRALDELPRRDPAGELITDAQFAGRHWIEVTTFQDAGDGFTRWVEIAPGCDCDQPGHPDPRRHAHDCAWRKTLDSIPGTFPRR